MFEELLIPLEDFTIQVKSVGSRWKHIHGYFSFERYSTNNKWKLSFHTNVWIGPFAEIASSQTNEVVEQIEQETIKKDFTTLKDACQAAIHICQTFLTAEEFQKLNKNIVKDDHQYHEIVTDAYTICSKESSLYLRGRAGTWNLYFDADNPNYVSKEIYKVFKDPHISRPQALKNLHSSISLNLHQIYDLSKKYYPQNRESMFKDKYLWMNDEGWWMMFVKPEIDLSKIF